MFALARVAVFLASSPTRNGIHVRDLSDWLSPYKARLHPAGSPARRVAHRAIRRLWHATFDGCPRLRKVLDSNINATFDEFLEHAASATLSMSWSLHVWFAEFLADHPHWRSRIDVAIHHELLAESCRRWIGRDTGGDRTMLLTSSRLEQRALLAVRPVLLAAAPSLMVVALQPAQCPRISPAYIRSTDSVIDDFDAWTSVPQ